MTPLILAVDGDKRQSTQVAALVKTSIEAEMVQASTASEGLQALAGRVPDLILTSPLLSPKDDGLIAGHLRQLGRAAAHVQTLTIPMLRKGAVTAKPQRGMLAALRRGKPQAPATDGCEPQEFAEQVRLYLATAAQYRESSAQQADQRASDAAALSALPAVEHQPAPPAYTGWAVTITQEAPPAEAVSAPSVEAEPVSASAWASAWPAPVETPAWPADGIEPAASVQPDDQPSADMAATDLPFADLTSAGDAHVPVETLATIEPVAEAITVPGFDEDQTASPWSVDDTLLLIAEPAPADEPLVVPAGTDVTEPQAPPATVFAVANVTVHGEALDTPDAAAESVEAHDVSVAALEALFGFDAPDDTAAVDESDADLTPADAAPVEISAAAEAATTAEINAIEAATVQAAAVDAVAVEGDADVAAIDASAAAEPIEPVVAAPQDEMAAPEPVLVEAAAGDVEVSDALEGALEDAPETVKARTVATFVQAPGAFDEFYVQTPAAEAWAALTTQPLSALTRPEEHAEHRVPMVDMGACEDLDLLVSGLAAPGRSATETFVPPTPAHHLAEPAWAEIEAEAELSTADSIPTYVEVEAKASAPTHVEAQADAEASIEADTAVASIAAAIDDIAGMAAPAPAVIEPAIEIEPAVAIEPPVAIEPTEVIVDIDLDALPAAALAVETLDEAPVEALAEGDPVEAPVAAAPVVEEPMTAAALLETPEPHADALAAHAPATWQADDDAAVQDVKPLLYQVFADEFEAALEADDADAAAPALAAATDEPDTLPAPAMPDAPVAAEAWADDAASPVIDEFLLDEPATPVATADPEPADVPWALPVLDDEALAMIGAAASRAFDEAVLRDFETALAQCDDTGTAWDDGAALAGTADETERLAAGGNAAATPTVASPAELVAGRVAVEFESKPSMDDWTGFGAGQAPLAALVDKRGPKGDRTRDAGPDRVKARVAAH